MTSVRELVRSLSTFPKVQCSDLKVTRCPVFSFCSDFYRQSSTLKHRTDFVASIKATWFHKMALMNGDDMVRYKKMGKLGEGTYGLVYKAHDQIDDKIVAIKKIKLLDQHEEGVPPTTLREISLLKTLKHPNIVEMFGVLYDEGELYLIFEFLSCDLRGWLDDLPENQFVDSKTMKRFTYFMTEGVRYCHSHRVLHRDLKPQNILVSDDLMIKLADFGLGPQSIYDSPSIFL